MIHEHYSIKKNNKKSFTRENERERERENGAES